jgi:hypothetical protein
MFAVWPAPILAAVVAEDLSALLASIESLLDEPPSGGPGAVVRIEQILTDGYARALELEAERWRLERRIVELARLVSRGEGAGHAQELPALHDRLSKTDADVTHLRGTLAALRRHASAVRAA